MHVMPPTSGPYSASAITVNSRSYTPVTGQAQTVPDQDGMVLLANGWTQVAFAVVTAISQAAYNAISQPDPNTLYVITG